MSAISDIRLAAQSSGIATLADARDTLDRASGLLARALGVLASIQGLAFDSNVDDGDDAVSDPLSGAMADDGGAVHYGGTLRAALESLVDQALAYAARVRDDIGGGDGPIDTHTRERVIAALSTAKGAFERVQDAADDPGLRIDFTASVMEGVKIAAKGITGLAKAVGAGAAQAVISLWWLALPLGALLAWLLWRKLRGVVA